MLSRMLRTPQTCCQIPSLLIRQSLCQIQISRTQLLTLAMVLLTYLAGTTDYGPKCEGTASKRSVFVQVLCDSDYNGDKDTRRSTPGTNHPPWSGGDVCCCPRRHVSAAPTCFSPGPSMMAMQQTCIHQCACTPWMYTVGIYLHRTDGLRSRSNTPWSPWSPATTHLCVFLLARS